MDQALKKINTMAELQQEKARLLREIGVSRQEMMRALGATRSQAKTILLKGIAIPAGVAGLTVAGVKAIQALRNDHDEEPEQYLHYSATPPDIIETVQANLAASSKWYLRLLPTIFRMVKSYLANRSTYHRVDVENTASYPSKALPAQTR
jgi:hypothetical protein